MRAAGQKMLCCRQIKKLGVFPSALGQTEQAGDPGRIDSAESTCCLGFFVLFWNEHHGLPSPDHCDFYAPRGLVPHFCVHQLVQPGLSYDALATPGLPRPALYDAGVDGSDDSQQSTVERPLGRRIGDSYPF